MTEFDVSCVVHTMQDKTQKSWNVLTTKEDIYLVFSAISFELPFARQEWFRESILWANLLTTGPLLSEHDDVIKWKHFQRYWPFVRGIHRSPVNSSPKGQWRGALMFSFIFAWMNGWVNNLEAGDFAPNRRYLYSHMGSFLTLILPEWISNLMPSKPKWKYLTTTKFQRLHCWYLTIDANFVLYFNVDTIICPWRDKS